MSKSSKLAVAPGDPAGIGPDVLIDYAARHHSEDLLVFADQHMLKARAKQLNLPIAFDIIHIPLAEPALPGKASLLNATACLNALRAATDYCLLHNTPLITGALNKATINAADIPFTGHTEWLANYTQAKKAVMLLANEHLKVALVTTHLPLKDVPQQITSRNLRQTIIILNQGLRHYFDQDNPHIRVCGLNPHAGENGHLGQEEVDIILPTINQLHAEGINVSGPVSADTAFFDPPDCVLAMYHDQGLPVIKSTRFGHTVNITLGLPFLRTSVDHGTAYPLASTGQADCSSFAQAVTFARHTTQKEVT